jgi:hypothetical protein
MKLTLIFIVVFICMTTLTFGQQSNSSWEKLSFLIGNWKGEGSGNPGQGEGYFSFKFDLGKKILVRTSHSEYPAMNEKPGIVHDDLMIIYPDFSGNPDRAIYFDNEGHVINYAITYSNDTDIIFTSDKVSSVPIFRLTYTKIDDKSVDVKFEIAQDGLKFAKYLEGKSNRTE